MEAGLLRGGTHLAAAAALAATGGDLYRIWDDGPVLRIDARGHWDIPTAYAYTDEITAAIADHRRRHPHLRAIVDRVDPPSFDRGVSEILMATYSSLLRAGDRVAIVVESSLAKGQIRQRADREETQTFLSVSSARTWVLAYG